MPKNLHADCDQNEMYLRNGIALLTCWDSLQSDVRDWASCAGGAGQGRVESLVLL